MVYSAIAPLVFVFHIHFDTIGALQRPNLQTVFVLIDSRLTPQQNDLEFMGKLAEWEVPLNIIFTKSDKNSQADTARNVRRFIERMKEDWEYIPRHFITSTVKKRGGAEILSYIDELNEMWPSGDER